MSRFILNISVVLYFTNLTCDGFGQALHLSSQFMLPPDIGTPLSFGRPPFIKGGIKGGSQQDIYSDTTNVLDILQTPTVLRQESPQSHRISYESTKSAGLAVLLSAVLPGAGQLYNESYWKAPLIWALGGYWVYEWIDLNKTYKDFRDQYNRSLETSPPLGTSRLQQLRDFYRDERDKFAWYLGALYFVNLLDAYVGANLYDFNVSPDLSGDGVIVPRISATIHVGF